MVIVLITGVFTVLFSELEGRLRSLPRSAGFSAFYGLLWFPPLFTPNARARWDAHCSPNRESL